MILNTPISNSLSYILITILCKVIYSKNVDSLTKYFQLLSGVLFTLAWWVMVFLEIVGRLNEIDIG